MLFLQVSSVLSHGFILDVVPGQQLLSQKLQPAVYNYAAISSNIDSLRSPVSGSNLCRSANPGPRRQLNLGGDVTISHAFSVGAQHIGPCKVEIMQRGNLQTAVTIAEGECARAPDAGGNIAQTNTDKSGGASQQCPGKQPPGLVTDDMCINDWTFKPQNTDQIKCTDCVLRWTWKGEHISKSNPELYENCIDVSLNGQSTPQAPSQTPSAPSQTPSTPTESPETPSTQTPPEPTIAPQSPGSEPGSSNKSPFCKEGLVWACLDSNQFVACFPESQIRASSPPQSCAKGTVCQQAGNFIQCGYA
ncbi:hypothetical protein EDD86DRAFT_247936 [Gorgonomyces haynaldii]|nr:hypothetical protein EDD86DRAFT_247936 [Gorgonomyces haynaldii]